MAKSSTFAPKKSEFQIEERSDNSGENRDIGSGTSSTTGYGIIGTHCTAGLYSFHNADSRVDNNRGRLAKPSTFASIEERSVHSGTNRNPEVGTRSTTGDGFTRTHSTARPRSSDLFNKVDNRVDSNRGKLSKPSICPSETDIRIDRRSVFSRGDSITRLCTSDYDFNETHQTPALHPSDLASDTDSRADSDRSELAKPSTPPLKLMFDKIEEVLPWSQMPLQGQARLIMILLEHTK